MIQAGVRAANVEQRSSADGRDSGSRRVARRLPGRPV